MKSTVIILYEIKWRFRESSHFLQYNFRSRKTLFIAKLTLVLREINVPVILRKNVLSAHFLQQ